MFTQLLHRIKIQEPIHNNNKGKTDKYTCKSQWNSNKNNDIGTFSTVACEK